MVRADITDISHRPCDVTEMGGKRIQAGAISPANEPCKSLPSLMSAQMPRKTTMKRQADEGGKRTIEAVGETR